MAQRPSERARFEILLEQVQSQLHTVAEGYSGLQRQLDELQHEMGLLEQKIDRGFATLGHRIGVAEVAAAEHHARFNEHLSAHAA